MMHWRYLTDISSCFICMEQSCTAPQRTIPSMNLCLTET